MHARPDDVLVIWHDMSAHVQEEEQPLLESTVLYAETREHKQLHTLALWSQQTPVGASLCALL